MPASGGDPVTAALCLSLAVSQGSEDNSLDKRLVASASPVLLSHIEYEPHGNCLEDVLSNLKNKCIVLRSPDIAKNGTDVAASSSTPNMPVSNVGNQNRNMKPEPDSILPTPKITLFPAHDIQLGWRGTHCVGAGMINVGNTCYLNSTLQALFHVPAFINWLHSDSSHLSNCTVVNGTVNSECIICAMNKTLKASQSKSGTIIKPFLIYSRLKFICKHLVHGQQEDAHEFMRYLLESMEKSYLTRYKDLKLDSYSKETTPLNQIFGGYIRTEVTCLQCGGVSTTFQHCQDLLLDIRRASTLDDALAGYFCKERLDGDDAYRCERCHKKVSATKKFSLEKPPQVLCIQFKRFSILGGKINKHVSFSLRLDLTRFLCPQSAHRGPVPLTYRLVSMVTHVGSSVHCGHYTAVAQTSTGHYYQFDDSSVRPISLSAVLDTNAYIMMYEREPKVPSVPHKSVVSAAATVATCAVNGQKTSVSAQGPVCHKIGSVVNHQQGCDSNSAVYTCASPLLSAKDSRKEKSAADGSEASEATDGDEHGSYEWVEKTHETLGISTTYQAQTNGHCWTGARKPDVTNHLAHLSHRGYGSANVTNWSGERCHMDEELEHDRREDRKRNCDSAYDEEFDRGRVKKVKHRHSDSYHSKLKYNPFQEYHNYKHQWGSSNGGGYYHKPYRPYNHYSNYQPRHKQYAGRNNGYHNGNRFHNHYSKRDRWRY